MKKVSLASNLSGWNLPGSIAMKISWIVAFRTQCGYDALWHFPRWFRVEFNWRVSDCEQSLKRLEPLLIVFCVTDIWRFEETADEKKGPSDFLKNWKLWLALESNSNETITVTEITDVGHATKKRHELSMIVHKQGFMTHLGAKNWSSKNSNKKRISFQGQAVDKKGI